MKYRLPEFIKHLLLQIRQKLVLELGHRGDRFRLELQGIGDTLLLAHQNLEESWRLQQTCLPNSRHEIGLHPRQKSSLRIFGYQICSIKHNHRCKNNYLC